MQPQTTQQSAPAAEVRPTHVVGIGASAGGLEALERLFRRMPASTGMAFVVVQHLSPDFESMMDELLVRQTSLPVHIVTDGVQVEPDAIYLIPPRKEMIISGGRLLLTDKDPAQGLTLPIDLFLRSLAQDAGGQAIGIILSGTGSDGSRGIRAIHEAGGLLIVQREETALFDGMPKSALATGLVDLVLAPDEMGEALEKYAQHSLVPAVEGDGQGPAEDGMKKLLRLLREAHGIDFNLYKESTVLRRIERRLLLSQSLDLEQYVRQVAADPAELNSLYRDLLIGVTQFFRDREGFAVLERDVLPDVLERVPPGDELRMWVAGCATGEEAYSLAILVHEQLQRLGRHEQKVKIFATDVHRASLEYASAGVYPEANLADVSPQRRERYFIHRDGKYHVAADLRKMIVFAQHNLVKDAPFTHLDLVSCRNLLIYFQPAAQRKVISLFHFGLKAGGVLFLGPSEGVGELEDEFTPIDRHWKVYRKRRDVRLPTELRLPLTALPPLRRGPRSSGAGGPDLDLVRVYDELLAQFMPPGVLINHRGQVVHVFGEAGRFLHFKPGRTSTDVLDLFEGELKTAVAGAIQRASKDLTSVSLSELTFAAAGGPQRVALSVTPLLKQSSEPYLLVGIVPCEPRQEGQPDSQRADMERMDIGEVSRERIAALEQELRTSRENLQATIEELETSNEELQATNEELIASNEELQSTNEELHSVNEELYTVNAEYQRKIVELTEMTDDLENLLASTSIGVLFLDRNLCIRKFTHSISQLFNVVRQDVGRPFESFTHNIELPDLLDRVRQVLASGEPFEMEVGDRFGRWHLLRILPYRSMANVEGVLLTLVDIQSLKDAQAEVRQRDLRWQGVLEHSPSMIFIKDLQGRTLVLNRPAERVFRIPPEQAIGRLFRELLPAGAGERVDEQDRRVLEERKAVQCELTARLQGKTRTYLAVEFPLLDDAARPIAIAGIWTDITQRKRAEQRARLALAQRDRFLATLSHELRNPLAAVQHAAQLLQHQLAAGQAPADESDVIVRQTRHMSRLLDDLLDISRIAQGKITLQRELVDLRRPAEDALAVVRQLAADRKVALRTSLPQGAVCVAGDAARLQQIQVNLLVNAIKYTPSGGTVELALAAENDQAVIRVRDTGVGMSKPLVKRVFELFVQGDETLDRADGGMGVGLTLVRSLVELHGGQVTAESEGLGQGSLFSVRLPLAATSPVREAPPACESAGQDGQPNLKLLVVEDIADTREMLCKLLRLHGFTVAAAGDGEAALKAIAADMPDVALLDIGLPRLDGYRLASLVRERWPDVPLFLVALTGYGRPEDRERAKKAGFDAHITKPVNINQLRSLLAQVAAERGERLKAPAAGRARAASQTS